MSQYIPVETPGGIFWAEIEETEEAHRITLTHVDPKKVLGSFEETAEALKKNASFLLESLEDLAPDEVTVAFGIKVGAEAGTPIFGLAKASGEASYTVTLKWKGSSDPQSQAK